MNIFNSKNGSRNKEGRGHRNKGTFNRKEILGKFMEYFYEDKALGLLKVEDILRIYFTERTF